MSLEEAQAKKLTFRKYSHRCLDFHKLLDFSNQDLTDLFLFRFRARHRRKLSRSIKYKLITLSKKLRKLRRETAYGERSEAGTTHFRNTIIVSEMIGSAMVVDNGKQYFNMGIKPNKIDRFEE